MTRFAKVVFALLVVATFSAFFVAQRLKNETPVVGAARVQKFFSPNGDGRRDREPISFRVKAADDVTVDVVSAGGDRVRRLATDRAARPFRPVRVEWDGRTDDGARAPDGRYRTRITLRRAGRSVVVPDPIELDTTPPRPEIVRARPPGGEAAERGPAIVTPGQPVQVTVRRVSRYRRTQFAVWRTDLATPRAVATFESRRKGSKRGIWDGMVGGAPAPVGTYLIVPTVEDRAGNRGSAPGELPPQAGTVPGRPGVMVRRLAVQPPLAPVSAGERMELAVDSRGQTYRWRVRRVGEGRIRKKGTGRPGRPLAFRAPGGVSGVYLLQVRTGRHAIEVPFLVQSSRRARILAVLPAIGWAGADTIDDDGDGLPNSLTSGTPVRVPRPFAGLPPGFADQSAPLLAFLDRARVRYDVTTDLALATEGGDGPSPSDREGVLLAGPERWIPTPLASRLRRYAERGGFVASFGAGALRRGVRLADGQLSRPTTAASTDAFGARPRPLRRVAAETQLVPLQDDPELGLLTGVDVLSGFTSLEEAAARSGRLTLLAGIGQDLGDQAPLDPETGAPQAPLPALAASRLGKGVVIRVGLPEWSRRLREDPSVQQVTRNIADILQGTEPRPRSPLR